MLFNPPLIEARLARRYKRFLADVELADGSLLTVHCPNPGAMLGLNAPGSRVWISDSRNPARKLRHTLELMEADGAMVGINTNRANALAREAFDRGLVKEIPPQSVIRAEVRYGEKSRIDFLIGRQDAPDLYVEVKNVHLRRSPGLHEFPDSVTARGARHLAELAAMKRAGHDALMLFIIQRDDGDSFAIAADLDPAYAAGFSQARAAGVEALAISCLVSTQGIDPLRTIPIAMPAG